MNSIFRFSRIRINICNSLYGKKKCHKFILVLLALEAIIYCRNSQNERAKVKKGHGEYRE